MLNSESLQRWIILNHSCVQALEALQELDPGTWLKGFVVAKRPFGYLISVAPPETEGRGAGARAIGLAYRKEVEGAPDVGSEVTWAPHLASKRMGITLKVAWTDDVSFCCWPCNQDKSWEFIKICSMITLLSYKVHSSLSHCCNMNERNLSIDLGGCLCVSKTEVKVKILNLDLQKQKLSLSMKVGVMMWFRCT